MACPIPPNGVTTKEMAVTDPAAAVGATKNCNIIPRAARKTHGLKTGDWKYGRIEVRARIPKTVGSWAAIWMLPTDTQYGGWPASGEIDIMENVGFIPDTIYSTLHTTAFNGMIGTQKTAGLATEKDAQQFHQYAMDWYPDHIDFWIDNTLYHQFKNEHKTTAEWPFDRLFHLILNVAVGGNWGGKNGVNEKDWPQQMLVDYVRVYKW